MLAQQPRERRLQDDVAAALRGLQPLPRAGAVDLVADADHAPLEVEVPAVQAEQLAGAKAAEDGGGEQDAVATGLM